MYTPAHFRQDDSNQLVALMRANPLGTVVVSASSGLVINHLPFVLDTADGEATRLRAHVPRANPLSSQLLADHDCAVVFHGADGYISPSWYATKQAHGRVVPTWNYAVVHVHGRISLRDDPAWVMTVQSESGREHQWAVSDAPAEFTYGLAQALVGLEVTISSIEGKTKASQNQPAENQASILAALEAEQPGSALHQMIRAALQRDS